MSEFEAELGGSAKPVRKQARLDGVPVENTRTDPAEPSGTLP
jgi:hypothetical protein